MIIKIIFSFFLAAIIFLFAKKKGLFQFSKENWKVEIGIKDVIFIFFIYIILTSFILPVFVSIITKNQENILIHSLSLIFINISFLFFSSLFFLHKTKVLKSIFKSNQTNIFQDIKLGFLSWFLAFSSVLFISNLLNGLIYVIFKKEILPDQVAIKYVEKASSNPIHFFLAIICIVVFAPLIEEFLFRGVLQNFLKKYFNMKIAIFLTSIPFAFLHFSIKQKLSNITIIFSLFTLSLILGLLYEKQRSLFTPIILHATFNAFSIFSLFFFKEKIGV